MEGISTPDGKPVNVDPAAADETERAFARAMSEPVGDDKQPPKRATKTPETPKEAPRVRRGRKPADAPGKHAGPVTALSREARLEGVRGLVQIAAGGCALGSRAVKAPRLQLGLQADAVTLASAADQLAEACADTAAQDERFARVIDKVCAAGPYSALIVVVVGVGTQIARNHGVELPGTHAPEELLEMAAQQQAA